MCRLACPQQVAQSEPVQKAKAKIKDKQEDIRETWETSQNPCVVDASRRHSDEHVPQARTHASARGVRSTAGCTVLPMLLTQSSRRVRKHKRSGWCCFSGLAASASGGGGAASDMLSCVPHRGIRKLDPGFSLPEFIDVRAPSHAVHCCRTMRPHQRLPCCVLCSGDGGGNRTSSGRRVLASRPQDAGLLVRGGWHDTTPRARGCPSIPVLTAVLLCADGVQAVRGRVCTHQRRVKGARRGRPHRGPEPARGVIM